MYLVFTSPSSPLPASTVRARPPSDKFQPVVRRPQFSTLATLPTLRPKPNKPLVYSGHSVVEQDHQGSIFSPLEAGLTWSESAGEPEYPPLPDLEHQLFAWLEPLHCVQPQSYNSHEINEHLDLQTQTGLVTIE